MRRVIAVLPVLAGREGEAHAIDVGGRLGRRLRPADRALPRADAEAVPVRPRRAEPVHLDVDGVRAQRRRVGVGARDDAREVLVVGHFPDDAHGLVGHAAAGRQRIGCEPCPQHHPVVGRIARRDAERERRSIEARPRLQGRSLDAARSGPQHVEREAVGPGRGRGEHASGVTEEAAAGEDDHERRHRALPACQAASITSSEAPSLPTGVPASASRASMARKRVGELAVGGAQQRLGIVIELAGEVGDGEQQVADLLGDVRPIAGGEGVADLRRLLVDLLEHLRRRRPVEADLGRLRGDPGGAQQRRQPFGHAVDPARTFAALLGALDHLDRVPAVLHGIGRGDVRGAGVGREDVRVTADQLGADVVQRVGDREVAGLGAELREEHAFEHEVADFALQFVEIAAFGRLDDFVCFLEDEGQQRVERLLAIPRTAGRAAQDPHQRHEGVEGRARGGAGGRRHVRGRGCGRLGHDLGRDAIIGR